LGLGIKSRIYRRTKWHQKEFVCKTTGGHHRTYVGRDFWELVIAREGKDRFKEVIGFANGEGEPLAGRKASPPYQDRFEARVRRVEFIGLKPVYDLTEPLTHSFVANGFIVHNCGEQPLLPYESCVARGTRIATDRGWVPVEHLLEKQHRGEKILIAAQTQASGIGFFPATVVYVGRKPVFRLTLANGMSLRLTDDHKVLTPQGFKEVRELIVGEDEVIVQSEASLSLRFDQPPKDVEVYQMLGWFTGDGWFTKGQSFGLTFGPDDEYAFQRLLPIWRHFTNSSARSQVQKNMVRCVSTQRKEARLRFEQIGFVPAPGPQKRIPKGLFTAPLHLRIAYLQGLFCADGSVHHQKPQVQLSAASLELLRDVQLLLQELGIQSRITFYEIRPQGRAQGALHICSRSLKRFAEIIGFPLSPQKQEKLEKRLNGAHRWYRPLLSSKVVAIKPDGEDDVYDLHEPVTHTFIAEGMVVHNCNLGSINLSHMVSDGIIDWEKLRRAVRTGVHFLDNVIDVNKYPIVEIERMTKANRKIGLGVMGFADMLIKMDIPYDSDEALAVAEEVMAFIKKEADQMSAELAEQRGAFPNFKGSIYDRPGGRPFRNATRTTIAPTGTISIIAGCSSGIEPLFAVVFVRHVLDNEELLEIHPLFEEVARREGFYSEELMRKVAHWGSLQGVSEIPARIRRLFVTAHEVAPEWHVRMQAAFQKYTDNAVSKTVNFPRQATVEDVKKVYLLAYELGCKGVTIYRDGSREAQVLTKGVEKTAARPEGSESGPSAAKRKRPAVLKGETIRMQTGCGPLYVTINEDDQGLFELFNTMGKAGGCVASQTEAIGRLISLAWRSGVTPTEVIKQLIGISCHKPWGVGKERTLSCADAIAKAIKLYLEAHHPEMLEGEDGRRQIELKMGRTPDVFWEEEAKMNRVGGACPECGSQLEFAEGCVICRACGYSECE